MTLNQKQLQAVQTTEGPVLIIAGPGSGKTKTLVERTVNIIRTGKAAPEEIFITTFTEKAARELVTRISDRLEEEKIKVNLNEMFVGTMHSLFLRILEEFRDFTRLKKSYKTLDDFDQQYMIFKSFYDFEKIDDFILLIHTNQSRWDKCDTLAEWINKTTEEIEDPETLLLSEKPKLRVLGNILAQYRKILEEENALDFSNIQTEFLSIITRFPEVLEKLQGRLKYFMIDEYQDTNPIQEKILLKLSAKSRNICVVGDDDQSLYRFRGATVENILRFPQHFPGMGEPILLEVNYRSHPEIIDFYSKFMAACDWKDQGKEFRYSKNIRPQEGKDFHGHPAVIRVSGQDGLENWNSEVLEFIQTLLEKGIISDYNQIAFLAKSVKNPGVLSLANFLEAHGVPVFSPRSALFFRRPEIRLFIGMFRMLFPQLPNLEEGREALNEIVAYYNVCFAEFAEEIRKEENKDLRNWAAKKAQLLNSLTANTDFAFSGLFYEALQFPLFARYLKVEMKGYSEEVRPLYNIGILSKLIVRFEFLNDVDLFTPKRLEWVLKRFFQDYLRFLYDGGIAEFEAFDELTPSGCISFMTIHQSKGLEFPIVLVDSLKSGPREQGSEIDILIAEHLGREPYEPVKKIKNFDFYRLFYTAFSRAKNLLVMSAQENVPHKKGEWNVPSKYFKPFYDQLPTWRDEPVRLEEIIAEEVKPPKLKKEYSFTSHIMLFENCAWQFKYFREAAFNPIRVSSTLFGTLVHHTIEDIHKAAIRGETALINQENVEAWFERNYDALSRAEHVYMKPTTKKGALNQVLDYVEKTQGNWERIKEAEVDVSLVNDKYILTGKIDLIRGENGTVEIIDFKTSKKPEMHDPEENVMIERYRRQLELYAHIVEERYGYKVSQVHLYYTNTTASQGNPYISWRRDQLPMEKTIRSFDATVNRIEKKDFRLPKRPGKLCENCDMNHFCNRNFRPEPI